MAKSWLESVTAQARYIYERLRDGCGYSDREAAADTDLFIEACYQMRQEKQVKDMTIESKTNEILEGLPADLRAIMEEVRI